MIVIAFVLAANVAQALLNAAVWAGAVSAIIAGAVALSKTRVGKAWRWFWKRVLTQPLTEAFEERIGTTVSKAVGPHLEALRVDAQRLEYKNDLQHGENKAAIVDIAKRVHTLQATLEETKDLAQGERQEIMRYIADARKLFIAHVMDAQERDRRIRELETMIVNLKTHQVS